MDGYETRLAKLVVFEDEKTVLVQDLIDRVRSLESGLSDTQRQLKRALDVTDMYQQKDELKGIELLKMQQSLDQLNYVAVLIDGDCMPFVDELLAAGELGGRQAARLLKASVVEYLRSKHPEVPANAKVTVRVYANLGGLGRAYCDAKVIGHPAELGIFVNGFNKEDALCDLVNAGDGKECADEKLKAAFQMSFDSVQCRHIVFGGSSDNGYARLLGPYVDSKKVSLLEGPPFAKELAELTTRYPVMDCVGVFRKTRLVAISMDWNTESSLDGDGRIARNAAGHRIDTPLQCSNAEIKAMKKQKLCNEFHILGRCRYGAGCSYEHGTKVSEKAVETLKAVARLSSCPFGLGCCDTNCILGHRCLKAPCKMRKMCFFPAMMHGVDTNIVSWSI